MSSKKRRDAVKNPGLIPRYNVRTRQNHIDMDYVDKLSPEEKAYLNDFVEEYYSAALDYKNLENNMHNTKELKKSVTDANNARNRCMFGVAQASGRLDLGQEFGDTEIESTNVEDLLIDYIDSSKEDL